MAYYQPTRRGSIEGAKTFVKNPRPPKPAPKPARKPRPPKPKYNEPVTAVAFSIPLLISLLELVHNEVRSEDELHVVLEKIINVGLNEFLDMSSYAEIVNALGDYLEEVESEDETSEDVED